MFGMVKRPGSVFRRRERRQRAIGCNLIRTAHGQSFDQSQLSTRSGVVCQRFPFSHANNGDLSA